MKTAGALLLFLLLLGTLGTLIITGIFQEFSVNIGKLGVISHVIFLLFSSKLVACLVGGTQSQSKYWGMSLVGRGLSQVKLVPLWVVF